MFMDKMAEGIYRLSVMDWEIDLFESQYPVPNGVSYNSYLIEDEKLCLLDTVDARQRRVNGLTDLMKSSRKEARLSGNLPFGAGSFGNDWRTVPSPSGIDAGQQRKGVCLLTSLRRKSRFLCRAGSSPRVAIHSELGTCIRCIFCDGTDGALARGHG